jgi:hypothetical protein
MVLSINFTNPAIKKGIAAILFYTGFFLACSLLEKAAPSGACVPGAGVLLLLLLPCTSVDFLAVNTVKLYHGKRQNKIAAAVHLAFLVAYLLYFYLNVIKP